MPSIYYRKTEEVELTKEEMELLLGYSTNQDVDEDKVKVLLKDKFSEGYIPSDWLEYENEEGKWGYEGPFDDIEIFGEWW